MKIFYSFFLSKKNRINILDVGGTQEFWNQVNSNENMFVTLINLDRIEVSSPNFKSIVGNGCEMKQFKAKEFDVVFSNSTIEHVGTYENQRKMAKEIQRVGKHYFVQTPNRYFFIEPHFYLPFFQFMPLRVKMFLVKHFNANKYLQVFNDKTAHELISSIRLLTKSELLGLFPKSNIYEEKFLKMVKSFIVYK